jgi:hypothetical protein
MSATAKPITMTRLFVFFLPLGLSASLVTISHVIINSTLARSASPELIISTYAIALSLLGLTERLAVLLRQTCSALVRDKVSFRAMSGVSLYVLLSILSVGFLISYTPLGHWIFLFGFGVEEQLLTPILDVYRILMFVSLFSGIRCLYHGVIISNMKTMWLTIGMAVRLLVMSLMATYFIITDSITSGQAGAIIFLVGMIVECLISFFEGRRLVKKALPEKLETHTIEKKQQVFHFFRPILYSSIIAVIIGPAINAMLGKSTDLKLAIASYAIAASLAALFLSFFSYMHQIILNFYRQEPDLVKRFSLMLGFIPGILLCILGFTSLGEWFLQHVMGTSGRLLEESLKALRVFTLFAFIHPWLDMANGLLMLRAQTSIMVWSQLGNVIFTLITLITLVVVMPSWNGMIGAFGLSVGMAAELLVVIVFLRIIAKRSNILVK